MIEVPLSIMGLDAVRATVYLAGKTPMDGCFVEVGVYQGGCAYYLAEVARERGCPLYLFDTFAGTPFAGPDDTDNEAGKFSETSVAAVQELIPDAILVPGIFPSSLPLPFRAISFVHCDCDQYESVQAVIRTLWPLIIPGGIMAFDDMDTNGGRRAIQEAIEIDRMMPPLFTCGTRHYASKP